MKNTYTQKELQNLKSVDKTSEYDCIVICPTKRKIDGYPAFLIIGCLGMKPIEIIQEVHGASFELWKNLNKTHNSLKMHMIGSGIFQFWSDGYRFSFGLTGDTTDIELIKR